MLKRPYGRRIPPSSSNLDTAQPDTTQIIDLTQVTLPGDHSAGEPPDPISNSDVKPGCANGTNAQALEE